MDECCGAAAPNGYEAVFDARFAGKVARRYRRAGLTPTERLLVEFLASAGIEGASVLEVGGGVGEVQLALLARGAAHTTNLELSGAYEADARRLIDEAAVGDRVDRILGVDLARAPRPSAPPTSWCCTASCAATPTTSSCWAPRPIGHVAWWSSRIRPARSGHVPSCG